MLQLGEAGLTCQYPLREFTGGFNGREDAYDVPGLEGRWDVDEERFKLLCRVVACVD